MNYKKYTIHIANFNEYQADEYHVWHLTHFNGAKIRNPLVGTDRHSTTWHAVEAAKKWIDRQATK